MPNTAVPEKLTAKSPKPTMTAEAKRAARKAQTAKQRMLQERALQDYLLLGPRRSLPKLCEMYVKRAASAGEASVPTTRLATLFKWSADNAWVEKGYDYERQVMAEEMANHEALVAEMQRQSVTLTQGAMARLGEAITNNKFSAKTVQDLKELVGLMHQLLGVPLATRTEVANPAGQTFVVRLETVPAREYNAEEQATGSGETDPAPA